MFEEEYEDIESVPSEVQHFYKEKDGKCVLLGADEIKSVKDVYRVQEGLRKEREDHKETRRKLSQFNGIDPTEVFAKLDRIDELEAAAADKIDDAKLSEMVETRLRSKTAPLERQIADLTRERDEILHQVLDFEKKETRRTIHDQIRKAGIAAKIRDTAMEDALLFGESIFTVDEEKRVVTKDGLGVTPGVEPHVWFSEIKSSRPHWWPESQGVGARGSDGRMASGSNPFSADGWNLTQQGNLVTQDPRKAEQMAKSAGTTIGGPRPDKK